MIEACGLTKHFRGPDGPIVAVDNLSFTVAPGTVLGLLGPNGAGKSTTLRMLSTLLSPDAGHATITGWTRLLRSHDCERQEAVWHHPRRSSSFNPGN